MSIYRKVVGKPGPATFHVDQLGSDTSGNGSEEKPFLTIQHVIDHCYSNSITEFTVMVDSPLIEAKVGIKDSTRVTISAKEGLGALQNGVYIELIYADASSMPDPKRWVILNNVSVGQFQAIYSEE